jgi:TPR repeat protein
MNAIGYRHQHGHGVLRDAHEAIQWYCLAIRAGNPRAMNNLAGMLASGDGIGRDLSEAIGLWEQSALLNHAHAMLNLGIALLQSGRDPVQGRLWLERAAMLGVVHAQAMLRRVGHAGPFPAPVDHGLLMKPAPQGVRGHTYVCDEPLTS